MWKNSKFIKSFKTEEIVGAPLNSNENCYDMWKIYIIFNGRRVPCIAFIGSFGYYQSSAARPKEAM